MSDLETLADRALRRQRMGYAALAVATIGVAALSATERSLFDGFGIPAAFAATPQSPAPATEPGFLPAAPTPSVYTRAGVVVPRAPERTRGAGDAGPGTTASPANVDVVPFDDGAVADAIVGAGPDGQSPTQLASATPGFNSFTPIAGGVLSGGGSGGAGGGVGGGASGGGGSTGGVSPTPAATATPAPTATETPAPVATATPAPTATATPAPVATATPAPTATGTPAPVATATPVVTPTATPAATPTPAASATPAPGVTASPAPVATATPLPPVVATPTPTPTALATTRPPIAPAVPEPDTWLMLLVGFGAVGGALRRRAPARTAAT